MKSLIGLLSIFILVACQQSDSSGTQSSSRVRVGAASTGTPMRWITSSPLNLQVSNSFDNDESTLLQSMMSQWDSPLTGWSAFNYPVNHTVNINSNNLNDYRDSILGIYLVSNWPTSLDSDTLAVTQYFGYTRNNGAYIEITHADILVNDRDFNFSISNSPSLFEYDLPSVVLHELGHFLGLRHNSVDTSVMAPYMFGGTLARTITSADATNIASNYSASTLQAVTSGSLISSGMSAPVPDEAINGVIELKTNGLCVHFENGIKTFEH